MNLTARHFIASFLLLRVILGFDPSLFIYDAAQKRIQRNAFSAILRQKSSREWYGNASGVLESFAHPTPLFSISEAAFLRTSSVPELVSLMWGVVSGDESVRSFGDAQVMVNNSLFPFERGLLRDQYSNSYLRAFELFGGLLVDLTLVASCSAAAATVKSPRNAEILFGLILLNPAMLFLDVPTTLEAAALLSLVSLLRIDGLGEFTSVCFVSAFLPGFFVLPSLFVVLLARAVRHSRGVRGVPFQIVRLATGSLAKICLVNLPILVPHLEIEWNAIVLLFQSGRYSEALDLFFDGIGARLQAICALMFKDDGRGSFLNRASDSFISFRPLDLIGEAGSTLFLLLGVLLLSAPLKAAFCRLTANDTLSTMHRPTVIAVLVSLSSLWGFVVFGAFVPRASIAQAILPLSLASVEDDRACQAFALLSSIAGLWSPVVLTELGFSLVFLSSLTFASGAFWAFRELFPSTLSRLGLSALLSDGVWCLVAAAYFVFPKLKTLAAYSCFPGLGLAAYMITGVLQPRSWKTQLECEGAIPPRRRLGNQSSAR